MKRLREDNLRALSDAEMADRAAEWRAVAGRVRVYGPQTKGPQTKGRHRVGLGFRALYI